MGRGSNEPASILYGRTIPRQVTPADVLAIRKQLAKLNKGSQLMLYGINILKENDAMDDSGWTGLQVARAAVEQGKEFFYTPQKLRTYMRALERKGLVKLAPEKEFQGTTSRWNWQLTSRGSKAAEYLEL